jgi:glycerate kinase
VKFVLTGALVLATLTGCSKSIDNIDSVKQGVLKDIPKDINVGAMDVNVVSVSFRGQEADAVVTFAAKGGPPMMSMNYTMERKSNEWHIKKRANGDIQKHAGAGGGAGAATAPPITGNETTLPPGHPAMPGGGQMPAPPIAPDSKLPAGHPPLGGAK